jgi:1-phosphofructokinase
VEPHRREARARAGQAEAASPSSAPAKPDVAVFAPSPLYTVTIEAGADGEPEVHFHAGGQGFWIARMVDRLGARALLCARLGGETGAVLQTLVEREGIALEAVPVQSWNGGYVQDRRGGERQVLADVPSARLGRHEVDDLYDATLVAGLAAGVAVLTGPAHDGVLPANAYERLPRDLGGNGVAVVADLSGAALRAVAGGVRYLKVSHAELLEAGYGAGESPEELAAGARRLHEASGAATWSCPARTSRPWRCSASGCSRSRDPASRRSTTAGPGTR